MADDDYTDTHPNERPWSKWRAGEFTLSTVVEGWVRNDGLSRHNANRRAASQVGLYQGTGHGLAVWLAYLAFRSEGLPVNERILEKFDQWALRLNTLSQSAAEGGLPREEGPAILAALELAGGTKQHKSLKRLKALEARRFVASDIGQLHKRGMTWRQIAERMKLSIPVCKKIFFEFAPGPRRKAKREKEDALGRLSGKLPICRD